jgi:hypothetical protein
MLFYEPGIIDIADFPLIHKSSPEPIAETLSQEEKTTDGEIPMIPEEFYQVQIADDELAKSIQEINHPLAQMSQDSEAEENNDDNFDEIAANFEGMLVEDVAQGIIDEITKMLGGNTSALYLCTDGQSELMLYNAEETCAVLDTSNEFAKELLAGNSVCVSSDVLASGILSDGIVPEDLNNCVSFLALPLEMMGMLLGVLFLGFEIEIGEEFEQVKDVLGPYMDKLKEALG